MSEMVICMSAWLNVCMRNDSKSFSKCIYTQNPDSLHAIIHSYLTTAEVRNTNI